MGRSRGKKALYEVIGKSRMKPMPSETEPLHGQAKPVEPEVEAVDEPVEAPAEQPQAEEVEQTEISTESPSVQWRKKPRAVQVNAGRVEFSLPYQVAVAVALAMVLVVIGSYRLGQWSISNDQGDGGSLTNSAGVGLPEPSGGTGNAGEDEATAAGDETGGNTAAMAPPTGEQVDPPMATGSNRIVIQTYDKKDDLVPVQKYFADNGVATEIRRISGKYYLVTVNMYENPNNRGTDGYEAKMRIVRLGAGYKAPEGYESFSPNLFSDAYGMKFDD